MFEGVASADLVGDRFMVGGYYFVLVQAREKFCHPETMPGRCVHINAALSGINAQRIPHFPRLLHKIVFCVLLKQSNRLLYRYCPIYRIYVKSNDTTILLGICVFELNPDIVNPEHPRIMDQCIRYQKWYFRLYVFPCHFLVHQCIYDFAPILIRIDQTAEPGRKYCLFNILIHGLANCPRASDRS